MSRSNNTNVLNPIQKYFEWNGSKGCISSYNKETKQNELQKLPFSFMVLDMLNCISGYNETDQSSYWSTEWRNKGENVTVYTKKGAYETGVYESLKCMNKGGKFAKSIYIAFKEDNIYKIGNIKLFGSGLMDFFEFTKKNDVYKGAVQIYKAGKDKKGSVEFQYPEFKVIKISDDAENEGIELDKTLQEYLKNRNLNNDENKATVNQESEKQEEKPAPFNSPAKVGWEKKQEEQPEEDQPESENFEDPFTEEEPPF